MNREQHLLLNVLENSDGKTLELFQENMDREANFFSNNSDGTSFCNWYCRDVKFLDFQDVYLSIFIFAKSDK